MKMIHKLLIVSLIASSTLSTAALAVINGYEDDVKLNACARASETFCQASTFNISNDVWCETYYKFNHAITHADRAEDFGYGPRSVSGSPNSTYGYVQSSRASAWLDGPYEEAFAAWVP